MLERRQEGGLLQHRERLKCHVSCGIGNQVCVVLFGTEEMERGGCCCSPTPALPGPGVRIDEKVIYRI